MKFNAPSLIPVGFSFEDTECREEGWGKIVDITSGYAELMTRVSLAKGENLYLHFELAGESFEGFPARVAHVDRDLDGYVVAEIHFREGTARLGRLLHAVVSRTR